jgi:hypothetical protein
MIQIDKHYYYKDTEYVVTGFCKVKTTSGEWVDGVSYKKASEESTEIYVRDKEAFEYYFIPTTLEVGDIIIAVSMGKVVAEYEVTSIDSESSQATAKSPSGIDLIVNIAVDSDAVVTKVEGGVPYTADYYYQLDNMKERMINSIIIDKMVSALSTAATRVQDIPASNTTYSLEESLKSIQQTLDVIYNKFGV